MFSNKILYFVVLFFFSIKGYTQDIYLFTSYNPTYNEQFKYSSFIDEDRQLTSASIGGFMDTKYWTYYGECIISHASTTKELQTVPSDPLAFELEFPKTSRVKLRIGLGRRTEVKKRFRFRFITYFGYGFQGNVNDYNLNVYDSSTGELLSTASRLKPKDKTFELGAKYITEYKCSKKLYAGVGLDFYCYYFQKGNFETFTFKDYTNLDGQVNYNPIKEENEYSKLGASLLNVNLILSYRL